MNADFTHFRRWQVAVHAMALLFVSFAVRAATVNFDNGASPSERNRWDSPDNWVDDVRPGTSDIARFPATYSNSTGSLTLTSLGASTFSTTVAGIDIASTPTTLVDINAGTASASTATISFGGGSATLTYAFSGTGTIGSAHEFNIGRNRDSTGTIVTSFDGRVDLKTRQGQRVNLFSTLTGAGSLVLGMTGTAYRSGTGTASFNAAFALGGGDYGGDVLNPTNNTFSGGVTVGAGAFLILGEDSALSGTNVVQGPIGTGTLTIGGGTLDGQGARIAAMRSNSLTTGSELILHNSVVINDRGLQTIGGIDMTWAGPVTLSPASSTGSFAISISPAVEGLTSKHTLTISGIMSGTLGFEKRGYGTLLLSGNNGSSLTGVIDVTNGVLVVGANGALGATSSGSETTVGGEGTLISGGTLKFADGLNYTDTETLSISGVGSSTLSGVVGALVGGTSSAATFGGSVQLVANATVNSGAGLYVAGPIAGSSFQLSKNGSGTLGAQHLRVGTGSISTGTIVIAANGSDDGTSRVSSLSIAGGTTPTATLDLGDNDLVVDYSGSSPLTTLTAQVKYAWDAGAWDRAGITSNVGNTGTLGLGIAENSVLGVGTFSGQLVDSTAVLIKSTWYGDANLDGQVNITDLARQATFWQVSGT